MAIDKDCSDIYRQLLDAESSIFQDSSSYISNRKVFSYDDEDDFEDFLTSSEVNPKDDKREKHLGSAGTGDGKIEEEVYFKRYKTNYEHKYTEKELNTMRESCVGTIVHDYSEKDIYHMSDEYRKENDMLNEMSAKLHKVKGTYRKVDAWIEAMRVVVEAWELLESKGNFIHTKKEFFEMVASRNIISNRIIIPKLKKMNNYDIDTLINYISNKELDPKDLLPIEQPSPDDMWYNSLVESEDGETEEEMMQRLLSEEEVAYILKYRDNPEKYKVKDISQKLIKGYDKKSFSSSHKKKKSKNKKDKIKEYRREQLHDILNKIQNDPNNRHDYNYNYSYMVSNSMFEQEKRKKSFFDDIRFDGSWTNKDDLFLYDLAVREEMLKQHPSRSKYVTFADQELQQFFKLLEENGVNTINIRRKMDVPADGGSKSIEERATKKENKKMESIIIQRITKLNENQKFKKLVTKAENALNKQYKDY